MKNKMFLDAASEIIKQNNYTIEEQKKRGFKVSHFKVDDFNFRALKQSKGDYYTIIYDNSFLNKYPKRLSKAVGTVLNEILKNYKKNGTTLIIGLGNSSIVGDSIGPTTVSKIIATNHYDDFLTIPKIALFSPEVIGKTGISSFKLIKMLVNNLEPDTIIMIDALATTTKEKLNSAIEISDAGIIPGSAINTNKAITSSTFGIPVVSIGIPLMIDFEKELYTTPNIESIVEKTSDIIANAINTIYF